MIEFIFSVDYEIYGNGEGSLRRLVYEPAERLKAVFNKWNARFVNFVEVAELEKIEAYGTDQDINIIKSQIRYFYDEGFELGLHIHPWWYNASYRNGRWHIDYNEYNLCALPKSRIIHIVDRSIAYFRKVLGVANFTPISFRAGHLLFQPTRVLSSALAARGIKVDSSVYKGGLWHQHRLDYRQTLSNGYYWRFTHDVNKPDPKGILLELPIYTQMVPIWKMFTSKRLTMQQNRLSAAQAGKKMFNRFKDLLRFWYPRKFDLGQITMDELVLMVDNIVREDQRDPTVFRPVVVIIHTKDLIDAGIVESLLSFLKINRITVSNFKNVCDIIEALDKANN